MNLIFIMGSRIGKLVIQLPIKVFYDKIWNLSLDVPVTPIQWGTGATKGKEKKNRIKGN